MDKLKIEKGIKEIKTSLTSAKTTLQDTYKVYLRKNLEELNRLFKFYRFKSASFRFHDYERRQRAIGEMANMFIDDGKKYSKKKRKKSRRNRWRRRSRKSGKNEKTKETLCQEDTSKKKSKGKKYLSLVAHQV